MELSFQNHIDIRRKGSFFLFLSFICVTLLLSGCSKERVLIPPTHYVRVEMLLKYHPLWSQVKQLDLREAAKFSSARLPTSTNFKLSPFPTPLATTSALPLTEGIDRQAQIERDAKQAAAGISRSLTASNRLLLDQEVRREQKRIETELASKIAEEMSLLQEINKIKVFAIFERLKSIAYQQAIYASRVNVYSQLTRQDNPPLLEARGKLKQYNDEADVLTKQIKPLLTADFTSQSNQKRGAILKLLQIMSDERISKRKADLDVEKAEHVAEALNIQKQDPVPKPESRILPPMSQSTTPLTLPEANFIPPSLTISGVSRAASLARLQATILKERETLVAEIRRDTIQAVEQASLRKGWLMVNEGSKGGIDSTVEMGGLLREQWRGIRE